MKKLRAFASECRAMILLVLAVLLSGCAALASKPATVGCQAADTLTTVAAINRGATEANPIVKAVIDRFGIAGFVVAKTALTVALVAYADDMSQESKAVINGVTCAAAAHNLNVIKGMK